MKIDKRMFKIIAVVLIQVFLSMDFVWVNGGKFFKNSQNFSINNLSPAVNISSSRFRQIYLKLCADKDVLAKSEGLFTKKYEKIKNLVGLVIKEKKSEKKSIAAKMIITNLVVDILLSTPLQLKISYEIIHTSILSGESWGNIIAKGILVFLITFPIPGLIRLLYFPVFKKIWPNIVKLTNTGLIANFMPCFTGSLSPIFFVNGELQLKKLFFVKKVNAVSNKVEKIISKHPDIFKDKKMEYSVEIAEAIISYNNGSNRNKFRIKEIENLSDEQIKRLITKRNFFELGRIFFAGPQNILSPQFEFSVTDYGITTRPVLLFGEQGRLQKIEAYLNDVLPQAYKNQVYKFNLTEYAKGTDNTAGRESAANFIKPMFTKAEEIKNLPIEGCNVRLENIAKNQDEFVERAI